MSQEVIRGIVLPPPAQAGDPLASVDTPSLVLDPRSELAYRGTRRP